MRRPFVAFGRMQPAAAEIEREIARRGRSRRARRSGRAPPAAGRKHLHRAGGALPQRRPRPLRSQSRLFHAYLPHMSDCGARIKAALTAPPRGRHDHPISAVNSPASALGLRLGSPRHDGGAEYEERPARSGRGPRAGRANDRERRIRKFAAALGISGLHRRGGAARQRRPAEGLHHRRRGLAPRYQFRSAARSDRARGGDAAAPRDRALLRGAGRAGRDRHRPAARRLCAAHQPADRERECGARV